MVVFVYGTLRDTGVLSAVLGHDRAQATPAWVDGYAARLALGHHFPMLRPMADARAEGLLLTNLDADDLAALDAFEGKTYHRRNMAVTTDNGQAQADIYIDDGSYGDAGVFDLAEWEVHHRPSFISSYMEGRGFGRPE